MICKKCEQGFSGTRCPKCGMEVSLRKRSTELDLLMKEPKNLQGTFEDGYQQGLRAGYANGRKDAAEKASGETSITWKNMSKYALCLGAALLLAVLVIVFASIGAGRERNYSRGYDQGWAAAFASEEMQNVLNAGYQAGYSVGYEAGKRDTEEIETVQPDPEAVEEEASAPEDEPEAGVSQSELPILPDTLEDSEEFPVLTAKITDKKSVSRMLQYTVTARRKAR